MTGGLVKVGAIRFDLAGNVPRPSFFSESASFNKPYTQSMEEDSLGGNPLCNSFPQKLSAKLYTVYTLQTSIRRRCLECYSAHGPFKSWTNAGLGPADVGNEHVHSAS